MIDRGVAQRVVDAVFPSRRVEGIRQLYGSPNVETVRVLLGSGTPGGDRSGSVVLRRQAPEILRRQASVLRTIAGRFPPAPRCYGLVDIGGHGPAQSILVLEYRGGVVHLSPRDPVAYAEALAALLVRVHSLPGPYPAEIPRRQPACRGGNAQVLLHGDFWPGNVLWRTGGESGHTVEPTAVIDWEDVEVGDPLVDIARTRSELAWLFGYDIAEAFAAAYQRRRPVVSGHLDCHDRHAGKRLVRIMRGDYSETARFAARLGRGDLTAALIAERVSTFLRYSANGGSLGRAT